MFLIRGVSRNTWMRNEKEIKGITVVRRGMAAVESVFPQYILFQSRFTDSLALLSEASRPPVSEPEENKDLQKVLQCCL